MAQDTKLTGISRRVALYIITEHHRAKGTVHLGTFRARSSEELKI